MARMPNLSKLSTKELANLIAKADAQKARIEAKKSAKAEKAWGEINVVIKKSGMSLDELITFKPAEKPKKKARKVAKVAPKYANPEGKETWAGRGRKPKWVEAGLAAGKSLDHYLIQ